MAKHGGARKGAGRKPKAEELKLIEKLKPLEGKALTALEEGLDKKHSWAIKLFMEYMYGKPKETRDVNLNTEQPFFGD